jgi:hypothetical protein
MPILIAVVPLDARPAPPEGARGSLLRDYHLQHLATSRRCGEMLVHVEADAPAGLASFRRDYPEAHTQPTHAVPEDWGDDWQQNSYPSELGRAEEGANPFEVYRRGGERDRIRHAERRREGGRGWLSRPGPPERRPGEAEEAAASAGDPPSPADISHGRADDSGG